MSTVKLNGGQFHHPTFHIASFMENRRFHQGGNHHFPEVSLGSTDNMVMMKLNGGQFYHPAFHLASFLENRCFHKGSNYNFPEVSHGITANVVISIIPPFI